MSVHETHHGAGECLGAHRHDFAYAALVLEGGYEEAGPEGVWRIAAGDLVLHPPFHLHLNRFERGAARVLNLTLAHAAAKPLKTTRYAVLRPRDPDRFARGARRDGHEALEEALAESAACAAGPPRDWLDAFAADLRAAPDARIGDLARAYDVTPTHAARAFSRRFGVTPAAFRAEQRLRAGLQALAEAAVSLADVAADCGFADQAHLTRSVVAATGQTPSRLRQAFA